MGDEVHVTELRCRHPYSQWGASLTLTMFPFFAAVWREESPEPLDARHLSRQLFRETFDRGCSSDLSLSTTEHRERTTVPAR